MRELCGFFSSIFFFPIGYSISISASIGSSRSSSSTTTSTTSGSSSSLSGGSSNNEVNRFIEHEW